MPFYRALIAERSREPQDKLRIVAVVLAERDQAKAFRYIGEHGLGVDEVVALAGAQQDMLRVAGTPTILIADSAGLVGSLWVGKLSIPAQRQVVDVMAGVAPAN
jgi:hypothetical protein